jgi:hypothetical protein
MYTYEKKVFDVSALDTKTYVKRRYIYIFLTLIIVIAMIIFTSLIVYISIGLMIPITLSVMIEQDIKKRKIAHKDIVTKQFKEIFYPSMISKYTGEEYYLYEKNHHAMESEIKTNDIYPQMPFEIFIHFKSKEDNIAITRHALNGHKKSNRIYISTEFEQDVSVEMRSFLRPKHPYTYKESMSGFMIYTSKKEHIQTYKKLYEKLRVMKDIDQLDVKIKDGRIYLTYKLLGLEIPNIYRSNDKVILAHETYINHLIHSYQAILKTLKESTHAHRN